MSGPILSLKAQEEGTLAGLAGGVCRSSADLADGLADAFHAGMDGQDAAVHVEGVGVAAEGGAAVAQAGEGAEVDGVEGDGLLVVGDGPGVVGLEEADDGPLVEGLGVVGGGLEDASPSRRGPCRGSPAR